MGKSKQWYGLCLRCAENIRQPWEAVQCYLALGAATCNTEGTTFQCLAKLQAVSYMAKKKDTGTEGA